MTKTELDWTVIESRIKAKEPLARIARDVGISRQALWQRCVRQGLTMPRQPGRKLTAVSQSLKQAHHNATGLPLGHCNEETASYIIDKVREGWTIETAIKAVGLRRSTFESWMLREPELDSTIRASRGAFLGGRESNIARAGDRGQWQADAHILAKDPETKGVWGDSGPGRGGVAIQVVLNVDRTPIDAHHITVVSAHSTEI